MLDSPNSNLFLCLNSFICHKYWIGIEFEVYCYFLLSLSVYVSKTAACLLWCCITCTSALIVSVASWANCLVVSIYRYLLVIKIGFSVVLMAKTLELMSLGTAAQIGTIINNVLRFSLYFSGDNIVEVFHTYRSLSHVVLV